MGLVNAGPWDHMHKLWLVQREVRGWAHRVILIQLVELQGSFNKHCVPVTHFSITNRSKTYCLNIFTLYLMGMGYSLAGGCFCSTQCQRESHSDIMVVTDGKGPRWLNSHDRHLGMDSWKAGFSGAFSIYLLLRLFWQSVLARCLCCLQGDSGLLVFFQGMCIKSARQGAAGLLVT